MIDRKQDMPDAELEDMYREAGDVEPRPGLDRMIRARAGEASGNRRASKRLPWLGGLATASVAIVAIAVVMQQTPPGESTPGTIGPTGLQEPKAFMAPSVGAPAASEAQREPDRSSSDAGSVESTAPARARSATDVASMRSTAPESEGVTQAERPAPDRNVGEKAGIGDERDFAISPEITDDPDAMLDEIRGLLDAGKTGQARAWLERLRSTHPDHVVPKDIEQALEEEASDR